MLNDIVCEKPTPSLSRAVGSAAHETLLWCAREKNSRYTFNYEAMKNLNRSCKCAPIGFAAPRQRAVELTAKKPSDAKTGSSSHRVLLSSTGISDVVLDRFGTGTGVPAWRFISWARDGLCRMRKNAFGWLFPSRTRMIWLRPRDMRNVLDVLEQACFNRAKPLSINAAAVSPAFGPMEP